MCINNVQQEFSKNLYNLGVTMMDGGRLAEAAIIFRKALILAPEYLEATLYLGHCLHLQNKYLEAIDVYDQFLKMCPDTAVIWNNRGTTLLAMYRYEDAAVSFGRAVKIMPGLHDAQIAMATCYQALGKIAEAENICDYVIAAAPENAEAHWNRALLLLLKGEYEVGWREYEWRWEKKGFTSPRRSFPQPLWRGEPVFGKTVLVHAEQGFGDTLQFCRYIPILASLGAHVIFECHVPLAYLMRTLPGDAQIIPMGQPLPLFDLHVPLMSLPMIFNTILETIPGRGPYLTPPEECQSHWQSLVSGNGGLKVGICWAGKSYPDPARSCSPDQLLPLSEIKGVSWYSLQVGWGNSLPFPMTDFTGGIRDFSDTAGIMSQLDMVITVDTAVAHLAGALGKPTWVMLPHVPDWRWLLERDDSPWYPSIRLFRQSRRGWWVDVVDMIGKMLSEATGK